MLFGLVVIVALGAALLAVVNQLFRILVHQPEKPPPSNGCLLVGFVPISGLLILYFLAWLSSPTIPSESDIIGTYEIDRDFHPGAQADWQHETYQLEITREMVIVTDARTETEWRYPISWSMSADYRWRFATHEPRHHMVQGGPAIVREAFGHYYIFQSPLYGDVVFRKKTSILAWLLWSLLFLILLLVLFWDRITFKMGGVVTLPPGFKKSDPMVGVGSDFSN